LPQIHPLSFFIEQVNPSHQLNSHNDNNNNNPSTFSGLRSPVCFILYPFAFPLWINKNQLAEFFATSKQNIGQHIYNILDDKELDSNSVVKDYFTTAADGKEYSCFLFAGYGSGIYLMSQKPYHFIIKEINDKYAVSLGYK
jgi:hypothetical protein